MSGADVQAEGRPCSFLWHTCLGRFKQTYFLVAPCFNFFDYFPLLLVQPELALISMEEVLQLEVRPCRVHSGQSTQDLRRVASHPSEAILLSTPF